MIELLGVPIDALTVDELHVELDRRIGTGDRGLVLNVNVHAMNLAAAHSWFRSILESAAVVFCDGAGVMLGARMLGLRIPQRITYADWMWDLAQVASQREWRLFLLGGRPNIADRAARRLREHAPAIRIVGTHHGYFDHDHASRENAKVLTIIRDASPDILVVGFGMPLQERWLAENWPRIDACVGLSGGAVFDYISGSLERPPRWMTAHGLEWLGRLVLEPRRLWKRYLVGNPQFMLRLMLHRLGWRSGSASDAEARMLENEGGGRVTAEQSSCE